MVHGKTKQLLWQAPRPLLVFFQHEIFLSKVREKEGDLTQSYDKTPYTNRKFENQRTTHTTPPKTSITQQLRTDLGRSVGVTSNPTGVVKPVYGIPTFPLTAKAV